MLGGSPERLIKDIDSNISFSPDGQRFTYFVWHDPEVGKYRLVIHSLKDGTDQTLAGGPINATAPTYGDTAWSPDGKSIVSSAGNLAKGISGLFSVETATGHGKLFFTSDQYRINQPRWLPDGSGLLVLFREPRAFANPQVGFVSYPEGKFRPVTRDTSSYFDLDIAADSRTLALVEQQDHRDLLIETGDKDNPFRQTAAGTPVLDFAAAGDGRLMVESQTGLSWRDLQSGASESVATGETRFARSPSLCRNGRYVLFAAGASGSNTTNIWRMSTAGGELRKLTSGHAEDFPACSPDSQFVVFTEGGNLGSRLMQVPIDGGNTKQLSTEVLLSSPAMSPDGKLAAFISIGNVNDFQETLNILAIGSGTAKVSPLQKPHREKVIFYPDGKGVVYISPASDGDNLWLQPLDGSPGKQLTRLKGQVIFDFGWSFDGKRLILVAGRRDSDAVLLRDTEQ